PRTLGKGRGHRGRVRRRRRPRPGTVIANTRRSASGPTLPSATPKEQTMRFQSVQAYMREQRIDGWLLHDFRGSNAVLARLLPGKRWTTRRAALFIPAEGE